MNRVLNLDLKRKIAEIEAGIILDELNDKLESYNLEFPVKPSSHGVCTLGGMIATNAVGNRAIKYGKTSNWVLELEAVNGKGEILKLGKSELTDFAGMEGITGVITKAKLKLIDRRKRTADLLSLNDLNEVVENVIKFKLENDVSEIEFLDKMSSSLLGFDEKYHLIVEFESERGKLKGRDYEEIMEKRDNVYPNLAKLGYVRIEDPKILLNKFIELAELLESGKVPFFGHLGVGILHPVFQRNEDEKIRRIMKYTRKLHGQVSGEHGIGLRKKEFLEPSDIKIIERIKKRYDPLCKINCGKVIDLKVNDVQISERGKSRVEQAEKIIEEQNKQAEQEQAEKILLEENNKVEENGKAEGAE